MKLKILVFALALSTILVKAQTDETATEWKPEAPTEAPLYIFHSTSGLSLPTAETVKKGDFLYSIEHRFNQPFSSGGENLWGLDGGVTMRMMLAYAISDDLLVSAARSNNLAQYELDAKYKFLSMKSETLPLMAAVKVGGSYNSKGLPDEIESARKMQAYVSVPINTMFFDKLAVGLTPSFLYNTKSDSKDVINSVTVGLNLQYYISDMWSVYTEYNPTLSGLRYKYDSYALGAELETGGHIFKFYMTNNTMINMTQYLSGTPNKPELDNFHFGFVISRNL